ncbi:MAG: YicC/YloC family endoribonuclease [Pseudomonadota bacterium]
MIRSMTAFARNQDLTDAGELVWELRSVNHRYLETFVRLPDELKALDPRVRERVGARLKRGKVEAVLRFRPAATAEAPVQVNVSLVDQLAAALREVSLHAHDARSPTSMDILRWPGVVEVEERDFGPVQEAALNLLDEALEQMVGTREREGARLGELVSARLSASREQVAKARERMPVVLDLVRGRLAERLEDLAADLDEGRVEQEMVMLTQRLDVDEEMDRLRAHLDEAGAVLKRNEPIGRRLDFLTQEMNREANTLASKSNDKEMTAVAVELKVLIEQIREQVQNIE